MNILNKLRKPHLVILLTLIIFIPTLSSCVSDNEIVNETNLSTKGLNYNQLKDIVIQVNNLQKRNILNRSSVADTEAEMEIILQPLVENGRQIYNDIISKVDLFNPEFGLTQDDINEINNPDDKELAQLALIYSALQVRDQLDMQARIQWDTDTVMNCLGAALGIHEIYGLIQNTAQLATAQGAIRVLKLLVRRYIGWVGVAVAVYSFGNCMEAW